MFFSDWSKSLTIKQTLFSKRNTVDKVHDSMIGNLGSVCGCLMSSSVDRSKPEVTRSTLNIASDLLTVHVSNVVGSPGLDDVPAKIVDPGLGSKSRHCSISISWVLKHIILVLEKGINPLSCILVWAVIDIRAEIPFWWFGVNVKLGQNKRVVEVVNNGSTPSTWRKFLEIFCPEVVLVSS